MTARIAAHLARCGLMFVEGPPPPSEDGYLLLWTGHCAAVVGYWGKAGKRAGRLYQQDGKRINPDDVVFWMRLPHPSFWPTLKSLPADIIPEPDLYAHDGDVFSMMAVEQA